MSVDEAAVTVDATGLLCPVPVIELARRVGDVAVGETIALLTDDPAAAADVPAWCRLRAHTYLGAHSVTTTVTAHLVRREH